MNESFEKKALKRAKLQKRLKKRKRSTTSVIMAEFLQSAPHCVEDIHKILIGDMVGHSKHIWTIDGVATG